MPATFVAANIINIYDRFMPLSINWHLTNFKKVFFMTIVQPLTSTKQEKMAVTQNLHH